MEPFEDGEETWTVYIDADSTSLAKELNAASSLGRQFSRSLGDAFEGIALKGKSVGDVLRGLALDLSRMAFKQAFKPLENGLGNLFAGLFQGGFGAAAGAGPASLPVPFAKGGVISSPTHFPLAGGMGVAGERGAEAILPLTRGPDGRLGVAAGGDGLSPVNVTFNVTTPDAESFQRSQSQVAAMLSRAVSMGQRNL